MEVYRLKFYVNLSAKKDDRYCRKDFFKLKKDALDCAKRNVVESGYRYQIDKVGSEEARNEIIQ